MNLLNCNDGHSFFRLVRGWLKGKVIIEWNPGVITSFKLRKVRRVIYKIVIEVAKKVDKKCTGKGGIFSPIPGQEGGVKLIN